MAPHRFHVPSLSHGELALPADEAHHALRVLRCRSGDRIELTDGRGTWAVGTLTAVTEREVRVRIDVRRSVPKERGGAIHLAVAPTKRSERFDWFVEKAVELGVDRITPLLTARSERTRLRPDRLEKVAIAAMKQSRRCWLPAIDPATELDALLRMPLPPQRFFGWCEGRPPMLMRTYNPAQDAVLLIGPEGDFTPEEAAQSAAAGFIAVGLGTARLRTETAALAACAWMSLSQQQPPHAPSAAGP
jgi:16S rRNA (uracil1498-N3)-methyltransferase